MGSASVMSVVCVDRQNDVEHPALRPSVAYRALNVTVCGGTLRTLEFESTFCPGWVCFEELFSALARTGAKAGLLYWDQDFIKKNLANFYLTDDYIVFLGADTREVDDRVPFGADVLALPHRDLVRAAPEALEALRDLGLARADGGDP